MDDGSAIEQHPFPDLLPIEEDILWVIMDMPRHIAVDWVAIHRRLGGQEEAVKLALVQLASKGYIAKKKFRTRDPENYWELGTKGLKYSLWLKG